MSGGKGGSTTSKVEIPAWLESAAQSNLAKAGEISKIGYTPYYGPDVAAMTPSQVSAMQGTNQAASAFGMPTSDPTAGMPAATNYGGMSAYSSAPMYEQSLAALKAKAPGQYAALQAPFINPMTGAQPKAPFGFGGTGAGVMGAATSNLTPAQQAVLAAAFRPEGAGARAATPGTGSRTTSIDTIGSYAPGGVNTRNPGSLGNRVAAALSGKQGAPTAADRPVSRSSGSGGKSGGGSSSGGGRSSGGSSGGRSESRR